MNKFLFILFVLASTNSLAGAVKWTDSNGTVHYSDQPPKGDQSQAMTFNDTSEWKATGFAQINDVAAVPYLTDRGRIGYREFLTHPTPRAFVICTDGSFTTIYGGLFVSREIRKRVAVGCSPYVVNDAVVWKGR